MTLHTLCSPRRFFACRSVGGVSHTAWCFFDSSIGILFQDNFRSISEVIRQRHVSEIQDRGQISRHTTKCSLRSLPPNICPPSWILVTWPLSDDFDLTLVDLCNLENIENENEFSCNSNYIMFKFISLFNVELSSLVVFRQNLYPPSWILVTCLIACWPPSQLNPPTSETYTRCYQKQKK